MDRQDTSRRAAMAKARQSRRPSRLGEPAGAAPEPDRVFAEDAGFPGLLRRVWRAALAAPSSSSALHTLLTLDGHVPADVQLRALRVAEAAALEVTFGLSWQGERSQAAPPAGCDGPPAFLGELGLTTAGQVVVRVPSEGPLATRTELVGGVIRVPWSSSSLRRYREGLDRAVDRAEQAAADCRSRLASLGPRRRGELLEQLKEAALRTAPFVLHHEERRYTNFRERNTLTGKTLWPGHPDCALSELARLPLELWSDGDAVVVACLALLVESGGFARIEEANGTQLTLDHVAAHLERIRQAYTSAGSGASIPPARSRDVADLHALAGALGARRVGLRREVQLYREIHGPLMHKIERIAGPRGASSSAIEQALCRRLGAHLPVSGEDLDELTAVLSGAGRWLSRPHGAFGTGLESLVYQVVCAATDAFDADFAMSRGLRSLPRLVRALREQDWPELCRWELPEFFCCVVPAPAAERHFGNSRATLADIAWSMSARMQYNSWHFLAGNLPRVPEVVARDHFVPPSIPDISHYSDQHHHGHVAGRVRFSIRSPQPVTVLDRTFAGFVDLRLLRCEGPPFTEAELLTAHRLSAFVAAATQLVAAAVAAGEEATVTAFDPRWHWESIAGAVGPRGVPPLPPAAALPLVRQSTEAARAGSPAGRG